MTKDFSGLLRPGESVEYCATFQSPDTHVDVNVLLVSSRLEAALLLLSNDTLPQIHACLPLYKDVITKTTQLGSQAGFLCELMPGTNSSMKSICVITTEITILQDLLHGVKRFVALADDLHFNSRGRSHQWAQAYQPSSGLSSATTAMGDLDLQSNTTQAANPGQEIPSSAPENPLVNPLNATDQDDHIGRRRNKDHHVQKMLHARRSEYVESRNICLKCSTWNMAGKDIVESLSTLLKGNDENEVTIYCTAFQEMDLSAEAYLTTTDTKAQHYQAYIEGAIGEYYELIASHQLVGMLLCIYAHKSIVPTISDVIKSYVPCGILGMIGNKGAVGVKFSVMDTSFAVVNCHLAAGQGGTEKRNSDFQDITKRIFNDSGIWHSGLDGIHNVIVLGDLNYRIASDRPHVDSLLKAKDISGLLEYDQLSGQRRLGKIFSGWHEGDITFNPTYKFDTGTDLYDSSDKQRIPSWTDRILIRSDQDRMKLMEKSYTSVPEYYQSDHKPVVARFEAQVEFILKDRQEAVRSEVFKQFDRYENEAIPNIKVNEGEDDIDFGNVYHLQPVTRAVNIHNSGSAPLKFSFSHDHTSGTICKRWFWPVPSAGILQPNRSATINITACVEDTDAVLLNSGAQVFKDVLVLHVAEGTDTYISLQGSWQSTCIGQSLDVLSRARGVRSQHALTSNMCDGETMIPKEIYRICEYLLGNTAQVPLFTSTASKETLNLLQNDLDTDAPFGNVDDPNDMMVGMCSLLLSILGSLTTPVVPESFYDRVIQGLPVGAILDAMPSINLNVLIYLQGFMTAAISAHKEDARLRDRLCRVFGDVLIRSKANNANSEQDSPQKNLFINRLISS